MRVELRTTRVRLAFEGTTEEFEQIVEGVTKSLRLLFWNLSVQAVFVFVVTVLIPNCELLRDAAYSILLRGNISQCGNVFMIFSCVGRYDWYFSFERMSLSMALTPL